MFARQVFTLVQYSRASLLAPFPSSPRRNEMPPSKGIKKKEAPIVKKESHVCATFLIGQSVTKTFKGIGTFKGRVTDFHRDTGFRVEYEDGDTEDLTEAELVRACTRRTTR